MHNPAAPSVLPGGATETAIIQTAAAVDGVEQVQSHRTPVLLQGHLLWAVVVVEIIGPLPRLHDRRNGRRQMGHHRVVPLHHLRLCPRLTGFHLQFHQACHQDSHLFNLLHRRERLWGHRWDHIGAGSKIKFIMYTFSIELVLYLS
mmetsp:Transcript_60515/g.71877  ORF Transcript_60515/g.71877 Transcript_60515/m.71877 type:complete len:146 (+) Transcript_60515:2116-2553(+)